MNASNTIYTIHPQSNQGFTLVELMISIVISTIVALGAYAAYSVQSKTFSTQREVAKIQQDLRGALYLMEFDLLNACRDPWLSNRYAITDVRHYDFAPGNLDTLIGPTPFAPAAPPASLYFASFPVVEFTALRGDTDGDGIGDTLMRIRYQIFDHDNDGRPDLGRRVNGNITPDLVAQGVVAIGYAFAYNPNPAGDYRTARTTPVAPATQGNVIWAADTDGDNRLDTNLDVNGDGWITQADDISGDGVIDAADPNAPLAATVALDNIVAVRIMLLVQSENTSPENIIDTKTYVVGNQVLGPFNDRFKRRMQSVTVALRNYRKT